MGFCSGESNHKIPPLRLFHLFIALLKLFKIHSPSIFRLFLYTILYTQIGVNQLPVTRLKNSVFNLVFTPTTGQVAAETA